MKTFLFLLTIWCVGILSGFCDTLVLRSGKTMEGTIIRTNNGEFLVLTEFGTYGFSQTSFKEVRQNVEAPVEKPNDSRLSSFRISILSLSQQEWSSNLVQIPATVIDKGVFKNVPYVSFRCCDDYEVNVYGDLRNPAAIEAGVYRKFLNSEEAKRNCLKFITDLLNQTADKEVVQALSLEKNLKQRSGLKFEITPPTAEDAYMGWWVSVYSEENLNRSRASAMEMASISVSKVATASSDEGSSWTADEMKLARSQPETITFVNSSGDTVSNAVVVRVIDGAYLIWRQGASGGRVALSDLPESIRNRFGYEQSKATDVYAADEQKRKNQAQALAAQAAQAQAQAVPAAAQTDYGSYGGFSSSSSYVPSSGGSVYVRGYTRKDGTYVHAHTRRK